MKQYEQVIHVMKENGGFATLGYLYQSVDIQKWNTKTPFASIRRIVQDKRFFFKIKPGLWALKEYEKIVLSNLCIENYKENKEFNHTYYQGLLVEIGNLKGYSTFRPNQDKNKQFLEKPLNKLSNMKDIFNFSYSKIVNRAKTVDVIWFNRRQMPISFFEVEHTTDFYNSLLKYIDLQDFYSKFYIIAPKSRNKEFLNKINNQAFDFIRNRIHFYDYEFVSQYHSKSFELFKLGKL